MNETESPTYQETGHSVQDIKSKFESASKKDNKDIAEPNSRTSSMSENPQRRGTQLSNTSWIKQKKEDDEDDDEKRRQTAQGSQGGSDIKSVINRFNDMANKKDTNAADDLKTRKEQAKKSGKKKKSKTSTEHGEQHNENKSENTGVEQHLEDQEALKEVDGEDELEEENDRQRYKTEINVKDRINQFSTVSKGEGQRASTMVPKSKKNEDKEKTGQRDVTIEGGNVIIEDANPPSHENKEEEEQGHVNVHERIDQFTIEKKTQEHKDDKNQIEQIGDHEAAAISVDGAKIQHEQENNTQAEGQPEIQDDPSHIVKSEVHHHDATTENQGDVHLKTVTNNVQPEGSAIETNAQVASTLNDIYQNSTLGSEPIDLQFETNKLKNNESEYKDLGSSESQSHPQVGVEAHTHLESHVQSSMEQNREEERLIEPINIEPKANEEQNKAHPNIESNLTTESKPNESVQVQSQGPTSQEIDLLTSVHEGINASQSDATANKGLQVDEVKHNFGNENIQQASNTMNHHETGIAKDQNVTHFHHDELKNNFEKKNKNLDDNYISQGLDIHPVSGTQSRRESEIRRNVPAETNKQAFNTAMSEDRRKSSDQVNIPISQNENMENKGFHDSSVHKDHERDDLGTEDHDVEAPLLEHDVIEEPVKKHSGEAKKRSCWEAFVAKISGRGKK